MSNMYTFQYTDFLNNSIAAEKFGDELTVSGLEYTNMDPDGVYMFFDHELSAGDYTTLSGTVAAHDGVPYPEEDIVRTGSQPAGKSLMTDGSGETKYMNTNNYRFAFYNSADPFIEEGSSSWVTILMVPFHGSGESYITEFAAYLAADDDNEDIFGEVRLYDKTNLNEMAVISGTNMTTTPILYSTTNLYNVPTEHVAMELQWRKTAGAPNENVRLYYVEIL